MGDIADAFLNGDFDEETGEWLGEGHGFPRSPNRDLREGRTTQPKKFKCPECGKSFRVGHALADHRRDKHPTETAHV